MNDYEIQKIRDTAFCSGYNTAVSKYEKQNKELHKENAELKPISDFQTSSNMDRYFQLKRSKDQLTEAKEIIREFVEWANWQGSKCPSFKSIQDKVEQFLNSEVDK